MKNEQTNKCPICGKQIARRKGNNPFPLKIDGEVCSSCNNDYVIPMRLFQLLLENRKGEAAVVHPDGNYEYAKPDNKDGTFSLKKLQELVGGYIEIPSKVFGGNYIVVCDEEGALKEKCYNPIISPLVGYDIVGDVVIAPNNSVL